MAMRRNASLLLGAIVILFAAHISSAATDCSSIPGARPATAQDAVTQNAGSGIKIGDCYRPTDAGVTQTAEEAKKYLISLPKKDLSGCAPPSNPKNIEGLNDTFAICAARFFKAYAQQYGQVTITSALRSDAPGSASNGSGKSANACAGGVPGSNHTRGVAMDVYPNNGNWQQIWTFASNNPQFGVCFPFQNTPMKGYPGGDKPHMILGGIGGSEGARCAAQGVRSSCTGTSFTPNPATPGSATVASPSANFADAIRTALGQPTAAPQPILPQQPLAQTQPITTAFSMPTPTVAPTTGTSGATAGDVSDHISGGSGSGTSSADILEQLAFGTKATTSGATSSFAVVINGNDTGSIGNGMRPTDASSTSTLNGGSPTQNTFATNDLAFQASNSFSIQQNSFARILESIRQTLLQMLAYLRPFGGGMLANPGQMVEGE